MISAGSIPGVDVIDLTLPLRRYAVGAGFQFGKGRLIQLPVCKRLEGDAFCTVAEGGAVIVLPLVRIVEQQSIRRGHGDLTPLSVLPDDEFDPASTLQPIPDPGHINPFRGFVFLYPDTAMTAFCAELEFRGPVIFGTIRVFLHAVLHESCPRC